MDKKVLAMFAISAAFLAVGCQKEKEVNDVLSSENTHSLIFTADKAGETRTAIASEEDGVVSYKWIEGDEGRMHIYEKSGEGESVSTKEGTITQMELTEDGKIATFHVTFEGNAPAGTVTYSATYGGKVSESHNPYIPSEQNPGVDSFDPNADAMFASEITKPTREENPTFKFDMARVVSVNKMTLKGLPAGDKVESVTFESDKDHYGYITAEGNLTNKGKKLIMTYTENNTIPSSGEFPVYFTTAPVTDATFTVTVVTDKKRYVKTSAKTISFAVGQVRRFGVNLAGCEAEEGQTFTLVESVSDLKIGNLVVIAANGSKDIAMSIVQNANNRGETAATKSSDYKKITVTEQVQLFTLETGTQTGTYAFHCVNGDNEGYIYAASSSNNYLRTKEDKDDNAAWKITITNNEANITAQGENTKNILRYNTNSNMFSCYSSGQQSVFIYTASPLPEPGMYWSASEAAASITSSGIQFTAPTLTLGNASSVTYSSSNPSVATISSTGEVSVLAVGTTTISAVFPGNASYSASTVSYVLTVTDDRDQVAAPTFNPAAGSVEAGTIVTISSATEGATIYYTVDGSTPTTASTQGTTVTIDAAKTVKAIAVKTGYKDSEVASATFVIEGVDDYATLNTSNVTLSTTGGTNATLAKIQYSADGPQYDAIKAGTGNNPGSVSITVPANTTHLHVHIAGWNGKTVKIDVKKGSTTLQALSTVSNPGITGNSPFTIEDADASDFYIDIPLTGTAFSTSITFTATSGNRFVIWGVNAE